VWTFLLYAAGFSLTGVMAPGSITSATIAFGGRSRWAGAWIAAGHGLFEIPLIFLLLFGLGVYVQTPPAKILIGLLGGVFLLWLGVRMLRDLRRDSFDLTNSHTGTSALLTGFVLTATNPYFLLWWAVGGLLVARNALEFGVTTLLLFVVLHWSLDLIWLTILSLTTFYGASLLNVRGQRILMGFCGAAMLFFGGMFIVRALLLAAAQSA
jgi:threonine/homoserine/homoserine lactone efflux protein